MALFGKTVAQWRGEKGNKRKIPNIRDFAPTEELIVLIQSGRHECRFDKTGSV